MELAPYLSIVIPCYNEENRLPRTLEETIIYLALRPEQFEVIVISDGSSDNTIVIAEQTFEQLPPNIKARAIEYTPNQGKGHAVAVGMMEAKGELVLFMDADYAVPLEAVEQAEEIIQGGADIAIGSRALKETKLRARQSFLRERVAKVFGFIQRNYLGLKLLDTQCGFKLFTRKSARALFSRLKLRSVIFDGEMLWLAKKYEFKVVEFPVEWTHDEDTRIAYTPKKALLVLLDMLKIPFLHRTAG